MPGDPYPRLPAEALAVLDRQYRGEAEELLREAFASGSSADRALEMLALVERRDLEILLPRVPTYCFNGRTAKGRARRS